MPDDSEFRIKVTIDAADATRGAEQTVTDVDKMADAVEGAGEKAEGARKGIERMVEEAGTVRESQRVAMGFFDTFEGGGRAVEGAAELMRFFLSTVVELDPPIATLLILMASLVAVFTKHGDEAKKSGDEATKAAGDEKDAIKDLESQATDSYGNMFEMLKAQTAEMLKQVAATKDLQRAKDELEDAQMAGKIADLDEQEQKDLVGKSESQQAAIKRDYEKQRVALRQQEAVEKANQELADKQQAAKDAQQAIQDQKNLADAEGQKLQQAYEVLHGGADAKLAQAGVKSDAQAAADRMEELRNLNNQVDIKGDMRGLSTEETIEYENLQRAVPQLQDKEKRGGKSFEAQIEDLKKQKADADAEEKKDLDPGFLDKITDPALLLHNQQMAADARDRGDKAAAQLQAIEEYISSINAAKKVVDDGVPKFQELNNAIPALTTKAKTADTAVEVAQQKLTNTQTSTRVDTDKLTAQQAREIAKEEFDKREAERDAQKGKVEAELKNPNLDAEGKARLQQQLENYTKASDKDKLEHSVDLGLPDAELIKLKGNAVSSQTATNYTAEAERQKAAEQAARIAARDTKVDAREVGQEALQDIQSLGGSHPLVEQARSAVSQMDQGHAAGAAQLLNVLESFSGTVKNMTQGQAEMLSKIMGRIQEAERDIEKNSRAINSLKNSHQS